MVDASRDVMSTLQEGFNKGTRAEYDSRLPQSGLNAKAIIDTPKNIVLVESGDNFVVERSAKLAKRVNDANLKDSAGGYIYKDGKMIYRTSSLYAKGEFPAAIISQMLQIHDSREIRAELEAILRDVRSS